MDIRAGEALLATGRTGRAALLGDVQNVWLDACLVYRRGEALLCARDVEAGEYIAFGDDAACAGKEDCVDKPRKHEYDAGEDSRLEGDFVSCETCVATSRDR